MWLDKGLNDFNAKCLYKAAEIYYVYTKKTSLKQYRMQ